MCGWRGQGPGLGCAETVIFEALAAGGFGALGTVARLGRSAGTVANKRIYVVNGAKGTYVGQSGDITRRLGGHLASGKFTQAEVSAAERYAESGGKNAREVAEQLKIDSLCGVDNLPNVRNPAGEARFWMMPNQPYSR